MSKTDPFSAPGPLFLPLPLNSSQEEIDPHALLPFATLGAGERWLHDILAWACSQPDLSAARYCYRLGHELAKRGCRRAAWPALETSLTLCYQQTPLPSSLAGEVRGAMGELLDDIIDSPEAMVYLQRALTVWRAVRGANHPEVAEILNNLGCLHRRTGQLDEAQDYYEQALAIWREAPGSEHRHIVATLNNLGALHRAAGRPREARRNYAKALAISRAIHGSKAPTTATILANLGAACQDEGNDGAARRYLREALSILEKGGPADALELATASNNLGYLLLGHGEYERAQRLFERALALYEKASAPAPLEMACVLNNLGLLYHATGKSRAAGEALGQAYALRSRILGLQHLQTTDTLHMLQQIRATCGEEQRRSLLKRPLASLN